MQSIALQHHIDRPGKIFSTFAYAGYMQLCSAIAGTSDNTESQRHEQQLYFDVCMCFFQDANLQHPIAMPIAQGLLYMALKSNLICTSKARTILSCLEERGKHHNSAPEAHNRPASSSFSATYQAHIVVNFEHAVIDVVSAQAHTLASKLEDRMLLGEYTYEDGEDEDEDGTAATNDRNS